MKTDNPRTHWPVPSTHDIMLIQETMKVMGLYTGNIDGMAGKETLRAVRAYKRSINLAPTNELSDEFIDYLRTQT